MVLFAAVAVAAAGLFFGAGPMGGRGVWPSEFRSNGERIYFTATSASGQPIVARGGDRHMRMMSGGGCVACHGADRGGGPLRPQFWKSAPPLTAAALFGGHAEEGGAEPDGHGDHDDYTDETLRRAISEGVDPAGEPLDRAMPRWSMSAADMDDLVAYLKTPAGAAN